MYSGCHRKQPYVSEPKVKAFIQWTKTLKDSAVLRKTSVGGYYCYPPPPPTFTPNTTSDSTSNGIYPQYIPPLALSLCLLDKIRPVSPCP